MSRRIFATVHEADFFAFIEKARGDKLTMGQALAALAYAYSQGKVDLAEYIDYYATVNDANIAQAKPDMEFKP